MYLNFKCTHISKNSHNIYVNIFIIYYASATGR